MLIYTVLLSLSFRISRQCDGNNLNIDEKSQTVIYVCSRGAGGAGRNKFKKLFIYNGILYALDVASECVS